MDKERIIEILIEWNYWGDYESDLKDRPVYIEKMKGMLNYNVVLIIMGIRRAGKTSLAELLVKHLLNEEKIEKKDVLYVNFEDPRFPPTMDSDDIFDIYETYLTNMDTSDHIVILDEVSRVGNWERFVRYLLESRKQRVIITGSSSKLLDYEVSEVLTGRHVDMEVTPLSFSEALDFRGIEHSGLDLRRNRIGIKRCFQEYCKWGGFPKVFLTGSEEMKKQLLKSYFEDILVKDVVKRFSVDNIRKLEDLAHIYISGISDLQSFNKLKERLSLSHDTVERYSDYLNRARLFYFLDKFDWSKWKQLSTRKKVYVADLGLYRMKGFRFSENRGKVMENMVAIELMRRRGDDSELYYWKGVRDQEVDFVIKRGEEISQLIQVSAISEEIDIRKREIRSLLKAYKETDCEDLLIITDDLDTEKEFEGVKIRLVPLWKWLLID